MFNVGLLEIAVIGVLGLLIFGPDKLPKAIQSLLVGVRSLRGMADDASKSLQDAAGVDGESAKKTMNELAELHPKRWAAGLLGDEPTAQSEGSKPGHTPPNSAGSDLHSTGGTEQPAPDLDPDLP